jgi:hypothetical protein
MPDLSFQVTEVVAVPFAAVPTLAFKLHISNASGAGEALEPIHSVALRCQIQIEATRRRYGPHAHARLRDLFGEPERWSQTLRSMLWTHVNLGVPPFTGETALDLPVACTFDFNVATAKYFYALEDGDVPLTFLFSGTIFYEEDDGVLQIAQIPWEKEATFRLPMQVWHDMMDLYYPNSAWLRLRQDVFDRLYRYKSAQGLPTWEQALERLLDGKEAD